MEFLEGKARNLGDGVINARLEPIREIWHQESISPVRADSQPRLNADWSGNVELLIQFACDAAGVGVKLWPP